MIFTFEKTPFVSNEEDSISLFKKKYMKISRISLIFHFFSRVDLI